MVLNMDRLQHIQHFYELLEKLEVKVGGKRILAECKANSGWPKRGVYFFFEPGESRSELGTGLRVVRVGTHSLKIRGKQSLWNRLRTHRGTIAGKHPGGGNHRSSVFRLHVGTALCSRDRWDKAICEKWGEGSSAPTDVKEREYPLEKAVSQHIRQMPFLWVKVDDEPRPKSLRGVIERNAIALLSNYNSQDNLIDRQSATWLGRNASNEKVRNSGLWNADHVNESYDPGFLDTLEQLIAENC